MPDIDWGMLGPRLKEKVLGSGCWVLGLGSGYWVLGWLNLNHAKIMAQPVAATNISHGDTVTRRRTIDNNPVNSVAP